MDGVPGELGEMKDDLYIRKVFFLLTECSKVSILLYRKNTLLLLKDKVSARTN